jgi:hypothetical protein
MIGHNFSFPEFNLVLSRVWVSPRNLLLQVLKLRRIYAQFQLVDRTATLFQNSGGIYRRQGAASVMQHVYPFRRRAIGDVPC